MASTSVIKGGGQQDLLGELRTFVAGATRTVKTNPVEFARTALSLLKTLPAARDAVLEYFCSVFDIAVDKYITEVKMMMPQEGQAVPTCTEEATITEIHNILCNFVNQNPKAWAPIISKWSLGLLGELSSRYSAINHACSGPSDLNDDLQLWMACRATRTLIDITTQCFSCLMHWDTDTCINALLDTSVEHSPHFDWVVAHVGGCFPQTVITKVLSCGLKDFSQHTSAEQGAKSPKLNSVVGILGHLAGGHFVDIRRALLDLFMSSLEPGDGEDAAIRKATVPFLFQLASVSPTLLRALTTGVLHTLDVGMLSRLAECAPDWCRHFGSVGKLEQFVVGLCLGCDEGGTRVFQLLLDACAAPAHVPDYVRTTARTLLELLMLEVDQQLRTTTSPGIALLQSVQRELAAVQPLLLSSSRLELLTAVRLLGLLSWQSPNVLVSSASFLLQNASTDDHLAALVRLVARRTLGDQDGNCPMVHALEQAVREAAHTTAQQMLWRNVATLLRWERSGRVAALSSWPTLHAVLANLNSVAAKLSPAVAAALELVADCLQPETSLHALLGLTHATAEYFFQCLHQPDIADRMREARRCCVLLSRFCALSAAARTLALRLLLENALYGTHAALFGASVATRAGKDANTFRLLQENLRQGTNMMLSQRHSSVFHTGVIGYGPRNQLKTNTLPADTVIENIQFLINAIKAACCGPTGTVLLEAMTGVSLLLVELISPDVMYNGLPWPEEEFCKVTVERDLAVRRKLDSLPVVWDLMSLVAAHRPTLCYCSVLLRALTATLISQWGSPSRDPAELLLPTQRLLHLLSLGQLLPLPLSSLGDVVTALGPLEVLLLLRSCVWNYLRDNVPSPALFNRDDTGLVWRDSSQAWPAAQYVEPFCLVLQSNIYRFGSLYSQIFFHS